MSLETKYDLSETTIDKLQTLIRYNIDAYDGFRKSAEEIQTAVEKHEASVQTRLARREAKRAEKKKKAAEAAEKVKADKVKYFADIKTKATKTPSGLQYYVVKKGSGKKPAAGSTVNLDYSGYLENGFLFDSSVAQVAKDMGNYIPQKDAAGAYKPIPFQVGTKTGMIAGFIEGIEQMSLGDKIVVFIPSELGYGERGAGRGMIPANANLVFELEMMP